LSGTKAYCKKHDGRSFRRRVEGSAFSTTPAIGVS
jgi:hypothetical protein